MRTKNNAKLESIRRAVITLSGRSGLVGLNMAEIAREASVATGTLYLYYENKEELLRSVYLDLKAATAKAYFKQFDSNLPLKTKLRLIWMNALQYRRKYYDEGVFTEQYYQSGFIGDDGREQTHRLFTPLFEVLKEGRDQLILKKVDPFLAAAFVLGPVADLVELERSGSLRLSTLAREAAWEMTWDAIRD